MRSESERWSVNRSDLKWSLFEDFFFFFYLVFFFFSFFCGWGFRCASWIFVVYAYMREEHRGAWWWVTDEQRKGQRQRGEGEASISDSQMFTCFYLNRRLLVLFFRWKRRDIQTGRIARDHHFYLKLNFNSF